MAKNFELLRAKMPPEARARAHEMARKDLAELDRQIREDPALAAECLQNGAKSGDPMALLMALRQVARSHADKLDHYNREFLERALRQLEAGEKVDRSEAMKIVEQLMRENN